MKGIPLAYNKDMQEDKEAIFDAVDTLELCLKTVTPMLDTMKTIPVNMRRAAAKGFIESRYGKEYYPAQARRYKTKGNAQDAHEAIRPSDVTLTPEDVKKDLASEQYRLYRLIWGRFLACQMASAVYDSVSIEAQSAGYTFRASHSELKFSGFTAVYEEGRDDEAEERLSLIHI